MSEEKRCKFRPKELAIILSYYDLGTIHEIHSHRRGNVHSPKSLVVAETGKYMLKRRAPGRDDPYRVALAHDVQLYLAKKGYCTPRLIGTRNSNCSMLQAYSAIYELFEYNEGHDYDGSDAGTSSAGRCLYWLHELLKDYHPDYQVPAKNYHDNPGVRKEIQGIMPSISKNDSVMGQEAELAGLCVNLQAAYDDAAAMVEQAGYSELEKVICHGDWHPGNMIFQEGQVVAVLDYDSLQYMPAIGDIANGCLQFSLLARGSDPNDWPDHMDGNRAHCFLKGYRPSRPWQEQEREMIVGLMIEALIAEAVTPIAATGKFANVQGFRFLKMVIRKVNWLQQEALKILAEQN
jgi:Ser/Thr protein kinase RdoA (MazF antagonist)